MRSTPNLHIESLRIDGPPDTNYGAFIVSHRGQNLRVIASEGGGWDHVSVSRPDRCPTWDEMCRVKELFFRDDETVMQLHVPTADHVNNHRHCLHLWRPQTAEQMQRIRREFEESGESWGSLPTEPAGPIPMPPSEFVGSRSLGVIA